MKKHRYIKQIRYYIVSGKIVSGFNKREILRDNPRLIDEKLTFVGHTKPADARLFKNEGTDPFEGL